MKGFSSSQGPFLDSQHEGGAIVLIFGEDFSSFQRSMLDFNDCHGRSHGVYLASRLYLQAPQCLSGWGNSRTSVPLTQYLSNTSIKRKWNDRKNPTCKVYRETQKGLLSTTVDLVMMYFCNYPLTKYAKYTALHEFSPLVPPLHLRKLISTWSINTFRSSR